MGNKLNIKCVNISKTLYASNTQSKTSIDSFFYYSHMNRGFNFENM